VKLKKAVTGWPLDGWTRGPMTWDDDAGILKLLAVRGPDDDGALNLVAGDAQLCRWSNSIAIDDADQRQIVARVLVSAVGRSLTEAGEVELGD
jgi:hypothetical protein